ncbi:MAG TPA: NADH-quinone oxidoreductase subunit L [Acidimicrobiia bacterium]|nr:NADH-quinone oxidoreductase subunit L [Acidimicrobiia bacterium]
MHEAAHHSLDLAWLIPAFPLAGFIILFLGRRHLKEPASGWIATLMMAGSFATAVAVWLKLMSFDEHDRQIYEKGIEWIRAGGFEVRFSLLVDPLSITMVLFVTGVGALIHLYSIGYMHGQERFTRFFTYLNMFAFSMLVLVLSGNYLLLFLGWEGVGLCSYLLISFWFERPSAARAGKKAFVTNRVGDFGFMLAMFLIFSHLGTLELPGALAGSEQLSAATATAVALLLYVAAAGKSAQGPLFVWLPDAMEGPTPVSALIHAATMVTAGVYLLVRSHPFLEAGPAAGDVVAWVGAITALVAATIALVNFDIKRVLAYSTISQLGYMFLAVGVGAYTAGIFHMVTHAFFKALMFLGAGSVMHGMEDEQDMRFMGGLKKFMPVTAMTFVIGWLAIAGVVPFAGFWSKDEILAAAWVTETVKGHQILWGIGVLTAFLTAFYMTRQVRLVFFGEERWRGRLHHDPHESPKVMTMPLVVLAVLSLLGGALNLPRHGLEFLSDWLHAAVPVEHVGPHSFEEGLVLAAAALLLAALAILWATSVYRRGLANGEDPFRARLGGLGRFFERGWGLDPAVSWFVDKPGRAAAEVLSQPVDQGVIDGAVNGVAAGMAGLGGLLRRAQTGFVRNYALTLLSGATVVLFVFLVRGSV